MDGSNCYFLTSIQVSQEAGNVAWYSHLFKNFSQFVVIHRVKGFRVVNKAEVVFFLIPFFSMIQQMFAIWSLVPLPFLFFQYLFILFIYLAVPSLSCSMWDQVP